MLRPSASLNLTRHTSVFSGFYRFIGLMSQMKSAREFYVSTVAGSVTRHTDAQKQFEATIFTLVHKFGFIRNKDLRDWSLATGTSGVCIASLLGVVLFFLSRPRRKKS
jgi:hypothetical protein